MHVGVRGGGGEVRWGIVENINIKKKKEKKKQQLLIRSKKYIELLPKKVANRILTYPRRWKESV